jgi:hypothetical protein
MSWYKYTVSGNGANNTWETSGSLRAEPADFPNLWNVALSETFLKLTNGEAVYGHPGEGGCRGPYKIKKFTLELIEESIE